MTSNDFKNCIIFQRILNMHIVSNFVCETEILALLFFMRITV